MSRTVSEIEALFPSLQTYKTNIRNAIIAQGVDVPSNATVSDYATYILQIVHVIPDSVTITSSTSLTPTYSRTTYTITFTTEGTSDWSIASNKSWCTFNTSSGSTTGSHSVTLTVAANNDTTNRSATITITCGTATGIISVTQAFSTADKSLNYIETTSTSQVFNIYSGTDIYADYFMIEECKFSMANMGSGYIAAAYGKIKSGYATTKKTYYTGITWKSGYGITYGAVTDFVSDGKCWYSSFSTNTIYTVKQDSGISTQPTCNGSKMTNMINRSQSSGFYQTGFKVLYNCPVGTRLYKLNTYSAFSSTDTYNFVPRLHYDNGTWKPCLYDTKHSKYYYVNTGTLNYG